MADLARLFARPHPTVNGWIKRGLNPSGGPADIDGAYTMLEKLESYLQRSKMLPVPIGMSPDKRIRYVNKLRDMIKTGKQL